MTRKRTKRKIRIYLKNSKRGTVIWEHEGESGIEKRSSRRMAWAVFLRKRKGKVGNIIIVRREGKRLDRA